MNRPSPRAGVLTLSVGACVTLAAAAAADRVLSPSEASFLEENRVAMKRMMEDMHIQPSGDIDRDFAAMMIPHHQGAIDMARAELRFGRNEQLRRIAQGIIVEQQQEIAAMRLALDPLLPAREPSHLPTAPSKP